MTKKSLLIVAALVILLVFVAYLGFFGRSSMTPQDVESSSGQEALRFLEAEITRLNEDENRKYYSTLSIEETTFEELLERGYMYEERQVRHEKYLREEEVGNLTTHYFIWRELIQTPGLAESEHETTPLVIEYPDGEFEFVWN